MGLLQSFVLFYEPKYFCLTLQLTSTSVRPQGAFAMSFSRAGILQQMHWLHLLHAISFLPCPVTYWQLPITPSRFSAFSFLGYWLSMGEREGSRWGQRVFHSLWIARSSHQPLLCMSIICFSHCQHGLLIFLCSLCLPVAHMGCSSFYTNPKLPGVRHNEYPSKTNTGARVDCWDANKITAIIGP